ncbi:MAG: ATP-binding cassette domain-containing protein [Morganella morganii]|nr:ATP-binding cassette domain-containing protein [Morganella morganii]
MADIVLENIDLVYHGQPQTTLSGINLTIPDNGITVILGASGCGKTSLLNIVAGFLTPSGGKITRNGNDIQYPASDRAVVFQSDALMPWLNVYENVALGLKIKKLGKQEEKAIVEENLQKVGLLHAITDNIWSLSGGMRQRVGIARALAVKSDFILMDEPFGALDAANREQMQSLILTLWQKQQSAFFIITHDIEEALLMATRLILMAPYPGRIISGEEPPFYKQWSQGRRIREIKSDPAFIHHRDTLSDKIMAYQRG